MDAETSSLGGTQGKPGKFWSDKALLLDPSGQGSLTRAGTSMEPAGGRRVRVRGQADTETLPEPHHRGREMCGIRLSFWSQSFSSLLHYKGTRSTFFMDYTGPRTGCLEISAVTFTPAGL